MVVVDVHGKEEDATGQDHGATHEEKVLVVLEDIHQEPCDVRRAGMEKGIGFTLGLTNKHVNKQTCKPRFGFGVSETVKIGRAKLKGAILEMTVVVVEVVVGG